MIKLSNKEITLQELEDFLRTTPPKGWKEIFIANETIDLKDWANIRDLISLGLEQIYSETKWSEKVKRKILILLGRYNPAPTFYFNNLRIW